MTNQQLSSTNNKKYLLSPTDVTKAGIRERNKIFIQFFFEYKLQLISQNNFSEICNAWNTNKKLFISHYNILTHKLLKA